MSKYMCSEKATHVLFYLSKTAAPQNGRFRFSLSSCKCHRLEVASVHPTCPKNRTLMAGPP
ncbi:hypothetical protein, partial [Alkalihalobacterium elongatum]|uniref:hypothetical protein n=1 Tax=Alkalihalobacterium elongatum TaxID=2675466 RepID=UPI001C1F58A2